MSEEKTFLRVFPFFPPVAGTFISLVLCAFNVRSLYAFSTVRKENVIGYVFFLPDSQSRDKLVGKVVEKNIFWKPCPSAEQSFC